jgi:hypothetical protein
MAQPTQSNSRGSPIGLLGDVRRNAPTSGPPNPPSQSASGQSTPSPISAGGQERRWWDRNPIVRTLAAESARQTALSFGALRGAVHTAEGLIGGATFLGRLANPLDVVLSPPGQAAQDKVADAAKGVVDYFETSTLRKLASDAGNQVHRFVASVDPTATPQSPSLTGEIARNFKIGMNQGELAFDVGSALYGGAEAKGLEALGRTAEAVTPAKYLARGYSPELADYFASPYDGVGHHLLPRGVVDKWPDGLKGIGRTISESPFFLLKPEGISKGDFYHLHYGVDPGYYGGKQGKNSATPGGAGRTLVGKSMACSAGSYTAARRLLRLRSQLVLSPPPQMLS